MEIKDFIGKVVINTKSKVRFIVHEITSAYITVKAEKVDIKGHRPNYLYNTINGDPITNGTLVFEDIAFEKPFREVYSAYCKSKDAYWENYGYWMRKD